MDSHQSYQETDYVRAWQIHVQTQNNFFPQWYFMETYFTEWPLVGTFPWILVWKQTLNSVRTWLLYMWQVAGIIPAATIQWQSIKLLWESSFCTGRGMLWRISFRGRICPANGKHSIGVKEWMTLVIADDNWKWMKHLNESHTETWHRVKVLHWKS